MRAVLFFVLIGFAAIVAILGGSHDSIIILAGGPIPSSAKLIGNVLELGLVWILVYFMSLILYRSFWVILIMLINTLLIWWMAHDVSINLYLGVGIDYIGQGTFDQWWGRIALGSGWVSLVYRCSLLLIGTLSYFSITKELKLIP